MARLDIERQKELEPKRIEHAKKSIAELGYEILKEDDLSLQFEYKGKLITFYPYSGWATGASIKDGRGLKRLIRQITN